MTNVSLETMPIPGTTLTPTRIALGTWAIGGWMWGGSDDRESIRTIRSALDRGITMLDTAPVYGFGHSEEIVGRALAESGRRHSVIIATKVGLDWHDGQPFRNASKTRILTEIEDSLRPLRTDVIDIYQVHWPDPNTPIEETALALGELYQAGKIRAIGVSNFSTAQMDTFRAVAPLRVLTGVVVGTLSIPGSASCAHSPLAFIRQHRCTLCRCCSPLQATKKPNLHTDNSAWHGLQTPVSMNEGHKSKEVSRQLIKLATEMRADRCRLGVAPGSIQVAR